MPDWRSVQGPVRGRGGLPSGVGGDPGINAREFSMDGGRVVVVDMEKKLDRISIPAVLADLTPTGFGRAGATNVVKVYRMKE